MNQETSDYELIRQYLAGDSAGFDELYERHRKRLYGYLNSLLPWKQSEVDDLFQQTWIKVIRELPKYDDRGCFPAWMFRISRNLLIDRVRKTKKEYATLELDREDVPEVEAPPGTEPWRELDESELGKVLEQAIRELPDEQREVFLLRREEVSFKEIAELQGCPLNTALARMQYALKSLRNKLHHIDRGGLRR